MGFTGRFCFWHVFRGKRSKTSSVTDSGLTNGLRDEVGILYLYLVEFENSGNVREKKKPNSPSSKILSSSSSVRVLDQSQTTAIGAGGDDRSFHGRRKIRAPDFHRRLVLSTSARRKRHRCPCPVPSASASRRARLEPRSNAARSAARTPAPCAARSAHARAAVSRVVEP